MIAMEQDSDIDISMIEKNLTLTPEERVLDHQRALEILLEIERARKKMIGHGSNQPTQTTS